MGLNSENQWSYLVAAEKRGADLKISIGKG